MRRAVAQGSPLVKTLNMPVIVSAWDSGRDTLSRGAPNLIIAHAPEHLPSGTHTAAIAITYSELAAASRAVGNPSETRTSGHVVPHAQ